MVCADDPGGLGNSISSDDLRISCLYFGNLNGIFREKANDVDVNI